MKNFCGFWQPQNFLPAIVSYNKVAPWGILYKYNTHFVMSSPCSHGNHLLLGMIFLLLLWPIIIITLELNFSKGEEEVGINVSGK